MDHSNMVTPDSSINTIRPVVSAAAALRLSVVSAVGSWSESSRTATQTLPFDENSTRDITIPASPFRASDRAGSQIAPTPGPQPTFRSARRIPSDATASEPNKTSAEPHD